MQYIMDNVIKYNLYKYKSNLFYCKGDQTLEHVTWRGFGFSMCRVIQASVGHSSKQPAIVGPALSEEIGLDDLYRCPPTSAFL